MKKNVFLYTLIVVLLLAGNSAVAGRQWYYQPVITSQGDTFGGNTAIGMRSGHAWPVVMTDDGAAAMVPGGWIPTGNAGSGDAGYIDAATSNDGQSMTFVDSYGGIKTFGPSGWSRTFVPSHQWNPQSRNSVAYTQQNTASVLYRSFSEDHITLTTQNNNGGWTSSSLNRHAEGFALAYDSYNQANVVLNEGSTLIYGTRGILTNNTWQFTDPIDFGPANPPLTAGHVLDMELNSNDVPYIAYSDGMILHCTTFDRQQGLWQNNTIDFVMNDNFCMAKDHQGGIGIAYVMPYIGDTFAVPRLGFAYTDGTGGWTSELLPEEILDELGLPMDILSIDDLNGLGLAFDEENNPVISFSNHNETWIAYDPVTIPEPATGLLLLLGGIRLLSSRKKTSR